MNIFSTLAGILLTLLTFVFIIALTIAIIFNVHSGRKYRKQLAEQVNHLRLGKMLAALGIDINTYLHQERMVDVANQMKRCAECEQPDECDHKLEHGEINPDELDFCNNELALQQMVKKKQSDSSAD